MQSSKGTKWARQLKALSSGLRKKTRSISSSEPENVQPDKFQNGNFDYFVAGGNFFNWKTFYQSKKMFDAEQMQSADPLVIFRWCGRNMIAIHEWQGISEQIAKAVSDSDIY